MTNVPQTEPGVNDEIPFYLESEICRHATTEPIGDYIGQMLAIGRPTPLEKVAEAIFNQVYQATSDLFAAWEALDEIMSNGKELKREYAYANTR